MKGKPLSPDTVARIARLLRTTDLTLHQIATRFDINYCAVSDVNLKFRIRLYSDARNFTVNPEAKAS